MHFDGLSAVHPACLNAWNTSINTDRPSQFFLLLPGTPLVHLPLTEYRELIAFFLQMWSGSIQLSYREAVSWDSYTSTTGIIHCSFMVTALSWFDTHLTLRLLAWDPWTAWCDSLGRMMLCLRRFSMAADSFSRMRTKLTTSIVSQRWISDVTSISRMFVLHRPNWETSSPKQSSNSKI